MILLMLSACADPEDTGLGECPPNPGEDLEFDILDRAHSGVEEDNLPLDEVEVFHDYDSLAEWWLSGGEWHDEPVNDDIDFASSQAAVLKTLYDGESHDGSLLDGIQWADEMEGSLLFRVAYECADTVETSPSYTWEVWVTPILPASACHMARCQRGD